MAEIPSREPTFERLCATLRLRHLPGSCMTFREISGEHDIHAYFGDLLLPLFREALGTHPSEQTWADPDAYRIIGQVPYDAGRQSDSPPYRSETEL